MRILADTKELSREDWLKLRKNGIGGSDASAVCGLNPWRSPIDVYMDKTKEKIEDKDSEAMRVGRDLEDYVAQRFTEATGKKVRRMNAVLSHDEHEWMIADLDRVIVGEDALLECKTANAYKAEAWADGKVPEQYEIQCHHYMAVTGKKKVYIACLIMGIDFVWRVIERDEEIINDLISIEKDFWQNHVLAKRMPPPDGSESAGNAIKEMYTSSREQTLDLSGLAGRMARYNDIELLVSSLKMEQEMIKQEIQLQMGEADTALVGNRKVTWKPQKGRSSLDSKKLREELPDVYERYVKVSNPTRVFRIW